MEPRNATGGIRDPRIPLRSRIIEMINTRATLHFKAPLCPYVVRIYLFRSRRK